MPRLRRRFEVKYLPDPNNEEEFLDVTALRKALPKGHWRFNRILEEVDTALDIHLTPSAFWEMSRQDQAYVMARSRVKNTIQAYEDELTKKKKP